MGDGEERAERRQTAKAYIAPQTPPAFQRVEERKSAERRISEVRGTRSVDGRTVSSQRLPSSRRPCTVEGRRDAKSKGKKGGSDARTRLATGRGGGQIAPAAAQ